MLIVKQFCAPWFHPADCRWTVAFKCSVVPTLEIVSTSWRACSTNTTRPRKRAQAALVLNLVQSDAPSSTGVVRLRDQLFLLPQILITFKSKWNATWDLHLGQYFFMLQQYTPNANLCLCEALVRLRTGGSENYCCKYSQQKFDPGQAVELALFFIYWY